MRLSKYLKDKNPDFSNREIKRALEKGCCQVNGQIEIFASREINPQKDKVVFQKTKLKAPEKLLIKKSRIIHEDNYLLIYDKEAGHACMATESKQANLHEELKKELKSNFLEPAHRLDKDTSGLIIFCKNKNALTKTMQNFKEKAIEKTYLAVVDGQWNLAKTGCIENYLELDYKKAGQQKWKVAKASKISVEKNPRKYKLAITDYKLQKTFKDCSLVELKPRTGRTHQLRVQLAHLGYPILGDNLYSENFKNKTVFLRHLLHAQTLSFNHPITNKKLFIETKIPKEMNI